jgi:hypothetical protein
MLDDSELSPTARREVRSLKRRIDASIRGYVEEGISDGSISNCDPKLAAFAVAGAINWIGTWYSPNGGLRGDEIASGFAELLTRGLARRNGAGSSRHSRRPIAKSGRRRA